MTVGDLEKALPPPPPTPPTPPTPPPAPEGSSQSAPRPPFPAAVAPHRAEKAAEIRLSTVIVISPETGNLSATAPNAEGSTSEHRSSLVTAFNAKFPKGKPVLGRFKRSTFFMSLIAICYVLLACFVAMGVGIRPRLKSGNSNGLLASQGQPSPPAAPPPAPPTSSSSGIDLQGTTNLPLPDDGRDIFTGEATYYTPAMGSCGIVSTDNDLIVAVSHIYYDAHSVGPNPNLNPLCRRKVRATRFRTEIGRNVTVEATVVDRCTGCKPYDLDFSLYLFKKLAYEEQGRVDISWAWI